MKRHDLDLLSLLIGSLFVAMAVAFLLAGADASSLRWGAVWPYLVIALGAVIIAAAARWVRPRPNRVTPPGHRPGPEG